MSNPKPFLEPDDVYARIGELERRIRNLENTPKATFAALTLVMNNGLFSPDFATITSGVYADIFNLSCPAALADALWVTVPWQTDAGTTGTVQLYHHAPGHVGDTLAAEIILPANSSGFADWKWLHGLARDAPIQPTIQAKRTGGAGNVTLWPPGRCWLASSQTIAAGATALGI